MRISDWSSDVCSSDLVVVGHREHDFQHARLGVVEFQHPRQQGRADLADRGAHWMAELAVQVPEDHRAGFGRVAVDPDLVDPRLQLLRSAEHTSELQSLMRISYAVFCLNNTNIHV